MDDYKYQQRRKKRGEHCLFTYISADDQIRGAICGCGVRTPPSKKYRTRIVKRKLKEQLRKEVNDG